MMIKVRGDSFVPDGTLTRRGANPAMNRWAIFFRPPGWVRGWLTFMVWNWWFLDLKGATHCDLVRLWRWMGGFVALKGRTDSD
jgi:hypothetical protein